MPQPNRPDLIVTTGDQARALRKKLGLNQGDFWGQLGTSQSGGSRYESGRGIPEPVQILLTMAYGSESKSKKVMEWLRPKPGKPALVTISSAGSKEPSARLYMHAKQFFDIAELAFADRQQLDHRSSAIVMNYALSAELFMKACDQTTVRARTYLDYGGDSDDDYYAPRLVPSAQIRSQVGGHKLLQVFDGLNMHAQDRLWRLFCVETGKDIKSYLQTCNDYFVHARYPHDQKAPPSFNLTAIRDLATGLMNCIPKWSQSSTK